MPFNIDLRKPQTTKIWTFDETTAEALELQKLLDSGNRKEYGKRLLALSQDGHKFTRTKGKVYELFDKGEELDVPVKFQVKNSVITWAFIAPMDRTHQSFRDLVFNTAAKAHACVDNSCETYYRGTNHYHLKVMHSYSEESEFNHNHYRTSNDGPITPVEVYQHIMAFYAQEEGKQFITTTDERDNIILTYAIYWADYNADIRYVAFSLMDGEAGKNGVISQLKDIAKTGTLTPEQANIELDKFFASEHGKNMLKLAEKRGLSEDNLHTIKDFIKTNYARLYAEFAPKPALEIASDLTLEPHDVSTSSQSSSQRSSPRDEYLSAPDQVLDEIDLMEYEAFAADLTKHCHSINKELLQDLDLEDFRKGLMLYHALRTAQQNYKKEENCRFHPDLTTDSCIKQMIEELPFLQFDSTEDRLGSALLQRLIIWVQTAPAGLDEWVDWVKVNGARGLGSEIALVRQANGDIDLKQAVPQGDRDPNNKLAEIDFDSVDLSTIFLPDSSKPMPLNPESNSSSLVMELSKELRRVIDQKRTNEIDGTEFTAKTKVINLALEVMNGKKDVSVLVNEIKTNDKWNLTHSGFKSRLEELVNDVIQAHSPINEQRNGLTL